jgi:large subunit ribosomal protein L13
MMAMRRNKTYMAKASEVQPQWHLIDATGQTLGRMATRIARTLQGKDKAIYTPHVLTGDFVVVVNASRIRVTGRKLKQKTYYRHSGYVGNLKTFILEDVLENHPERVMEMAVRGMLPNTKRGRDMFKRLKVYRGNTHPHQAQLSAVVTSAPTNGGSEGR